MDRFDEMRVKNISGGGGTVIIPPEAGNLIGIAVTKMPTKLDYIEGDSIDLAGLEVTAIYDNNVNGIVTSACTVTVNDPLTVYDKSVSISYEGFETSFDIKVYGQVNSIPSGTEYLFHCESNLINSITGKVEATAGASASSYLGGKFNKGIQSIISLSNRDNRLPKMMDVTSGNSSLTMECWLYLMTSGNSTDLSQATSIINLYGSGSIYRISGGNGYIKMYGLDSNVESVDSKQYTITSDFISKGWHHYAWVFKDGYQKLFIDGKKVLSGKCSIDTRTGTINPYFGASYYNCVYDELLISTEALYSADFEPPTNIYGSEKILDKIYFKNKPTKTIYQSGEKFDTTGMAVNAVFSDGSEKDVTTDCVIENGVELNTSIKTVTISYTYNGLKKKLPISVGVYTVESSVDLSSAKLLMNFDMNTQDLTGINTPTIVDNDNYGVGQFGQARYFNGTTDYISMPYTDEININTGDFTIACWIKLLTVEGTHVIWSNMNSTYGSRIYTSGNRLHIAICTSTDDTTIPGLSGDKILGVNTWYHIAIVRKGNTFISYLDGKIIATAEYTSTLVSENNLLIGKFTDSQPFLFNGYIDDFIIVKSALWDGEFTPPNVPFTNLVAEKIPKILEKIYLKKSPTRLSYEVGETFSLEGAEVRAKYYNGDDEDITSQCVIMSDTTIADDTEKITISYTYDGTTKYLDINVSILRPYISVNYIKSTGTQYIDTGFKAKPTTRIVMQFKFNDASTKQQILWGTALNDGNTENLILKSYINGAGYLAYSYNDSTGNSKATSKVADTNKHIYDFDGANRVYKLDGATIENIQGTATNTSLQTLKLLSENPSSVNAIGQLYSCKIYDDGVLVRDYRPCVLQETNEAGVWDVIEEKFYGNKGTGSFTFG